MLHDDPQPTILLIKNFWNLSDEFLTIKTEPRVYCAPSNSSWNNDHQISVSKKKINNQKQPMSSKENSILPGSVSFNGCGGTGKKIHCSLVWSSFVSLLLSRVREDMNVWAQHRCSGISSGYSSQKVCSHSLALSYVFGGQSVFTWHSRRCACKK